jgi:hypothetical protein
MPRVLSALMAFVVSLLPSHAVLRLENLALGQQVAVYKCTVCRPRTPGARIGPGGWTRH